MIFCLIFTVSAVSANSNATDNQVIMTDLNVDTAICGVDTFESDNVNIYTATDVVNDTSEQKTLLSAGNHENILSTEKDEKGDSGENPLLESNSNEDVLSSDGLEKTVLGATSDELLSAGDKTFTDLKNEITADKTITLSGNYYQYVSADGNNFAINVTNKIIDGNGATIDGSNLKYPFVSSGNITFKNINFINTKNTDRIPLGGGALYFINGASNIIITNCNFTNTQAPNGFGGAIRIYDSGGNISIKNCHFEGTTASNTGSIMIYAASNSIITDNITIEGCKFNNIITNDNGIIQFRKVSNVTIKNCDFTNSRGVRERQAFIKADGSFINSTISYCNFINKTTTTGSCIVLSGTNNNVTHCNFSNINGGHGEGRAGSGIVLSATRNCLVDDCNFTNIYGSGRGGAIAFVNSHYDTVNNSYFENCSCSVSGGAINFFSGTSDFTKILYSTFLNCYCGKELSGTIGGGNGGAMEMFSAYSVVDHCTFINNTAYSYSKARVYCAGNGGAIVMWMNAHDVNVTNCDFYNNTAGQHSDDDAQSNGGAICMYDATDYNCNLINCTFTGNRAFMHGGAVQYNAKDSYMENCTFTNNSAALDGGAICSKSQGSIVNVSKFDGNTAPRGMDFYSHDGCEITFIGLKFNALWLTNSNDLRTVHGAHGLRWDDPAGWDDLDQVLTFLNTEKGKTTIYQQQHINKNQPTN